MMEYAKDIALCIVASIALVFFAGLLNSNFFEVVISSLLEVVFAVFAINIASAGIIAQLIRKVTEKTGHPMEASRTVVLEELKLQAIMLIASIILLVTYHSKIESSSILFDIADNIKYCSEIGLLAIYLYFIWLTYDLGKTLFEILKRIS